MPLVENKTKLKLKNNELALGFGVHHLRTSATAMLAAAADHDWLFIDMEHGAHSVHEAAQLCIAALPTGVTPIVRICAGALDEGTRALDNGALGVIVPHVDTAERAQEIARAFRYPPLGTRSWGGPPSGHTVSVRPATPRRRPRSTRRCWWSQSSKAHKRWATRRPSPPSMASIAC